MTQGYPEVGTAEGRLGVLLPGMGAVATTTIAGPAHETMGEFEKAMEANDPAIAPSALRIRGA